MQSKVWQRGEYKETTDKTDFSQQQCFVKSDFPKSPLCRDTSILCWWMWQSLRMRGKGNTPGAGEQEQRQPNRCKMSERWQREERRDGLQCARMFVISWGAFSAVQPPTGGAAWVPAAPGNGTQAGGRAGGTGRGSLRCPCWLYFGGAPMGGCGHHFTPAEILFAVSSGVFCRSGERERRKPHVRDVWSCGSTHLASSRQREGVVIMHSTLQHGAILARKPDFCMERAGGRQALFRKCVWFCTCSSQSSDRYYPGTNP